MKDETRHTVEEHHDDLEALAESDSRAAPIAEAILKFAE